MEGNLLYQSADPFNKEDRRIRNAILGMTQTCMPLLIGCYEKDGQWGIWYSIHNKHLLLNPMDLVSSIYQDETIYPISTKDKEAFENRYYISVFLDKYRYVWQVFHNDLDQVFIYYFTISEYTNKITKAIKALYQVWTENKPVAYDSLDANLENVERCVAQLHARHTFPNYYRLMTNQLTIDTFVFSPHYEEKYEIGFANRKYETFLTYWCNDIEKIRHQIESFVYGGKAEIILEFDGSENIIKLERTSVLDEINKDENGVGYQYKSYMRVEIQPSGFDNYPCILKGYCEEKQVIWTLYEGLMLMFRQYPVDGKDTGQDLTNRITAYNRMKSPIIESYLKGEKYEPNTYNNRQVHVKHILAINPDIGQLFYDEDGCSFDDFDDEYIYDKLGQPIIFDEFLKWRSETDCLVIGSGTSSPINKDWEDFHRRGLEMAKTLRDRLSPDFDLWYEAPIDDRSGTIRSPQLIL